jgi:hypothetical protein
MTSTRNLRKSTLILVAILWVISTMETMGLRRLALPSMRRLLRHHEFTHQTRTSLYMSTADDHMEEILEDIIFSGDVAGFVRKSKDVLEPDFKTFLDGRMSSCHEDDERRILTEIIQLVTAKQEEEAQRKEMAQSILNSILVDTPAEKGISTEPAGNSVDDLRKHLMGVQQGKEVDAEGKVVDRLGVFDKKKEKEDSGIKASSTTQVWYLVDAFTRLCVDNPHSPPLSLYRGNLITIPTRNLYIYVYTIVTDNVQVQDEGEMKAREVAAIIRKRELEAEAAAQREAEKAAGNQQITRGF